MSARPPVVGEAILSLPLVLFVALFSLVPVGALFAAGLLQSGGLEGLAHVLANPVNDRAIENSFLQGSLSAAGALAIGYPVGVFLGRYTWPGRSAVRAVLLVPFLLPTVVVVLGVLDLFGPAGLLSGRIPALAVFGRGTGGILAVNVFFNVSLVALLTAVACEQSSRALEETVATLGGSPGRAWRDVWGLPSLLGAAAGALLTFLFSALAFAAPLMICGARCYTLEARVWSLDQELLEPVPAELLALAMVLLLLGPALLYLLLVTRVRARTSSRGEAARRIPWRSPTSYLLVGLTSLTVATVGLFLAVLVLRSLGAVGGRFSGAAWAELFGSHVGSVLGLSAGAALVNTLFFAAVGTALVLLLGLGGGFVVTRRRRAGRLLSLYLFLPLLLSPVVVAFALAYFWRPVFGGETNVWWLVILSQATLALPFAWQSLELPLRWGPRAEREVARTLGASARGAYLDVDLPLVRGGLWTASLFAFALSLGEFTATNFLVTPRFTTLSVAVYRLYGTRLVAAANAAGALLVLVSLGVLLALVLGGRRVEL